MNNTSFNTMSEQEMLTDILSQEKQLIKDYASSVTESSCPNLRQLLISNMTECSNDQYCVFDQMHSRNMYATKQAPDTEVQTARQNMDQLRQQTGL
ncbi:MAG: spore coat protein [Christensenellaceae bacterium]|jgi:spore coat protein CotF|nr:spore coat protein [Christensenellaceae bacterium]